MVEIIIGRAGTGKTFACLEHMKKILATSPLSTEIIYLLPAYQTYRAELELANLTGGAVNTLMCSFQRFARQILNEVAGSTVPRISETGRRLLLRKILISRAANLKYYERAAKQRGFVEVLAQELKNLRSYSIDAEKLRSAQIDDEELKNKIHDLALLYEDFRAAIADKQNDESDLIERASELIKDSAAIKRAEIFIDGFIFFDPQQRKILREIFKYARNVYITLPMDTDLNSRENVRDTGIFNRAYKTFKILEDMTDFKIVRCNAAKRFETDALKFIEQNFFARVPKKFAGNADSLKIVEAVNPRVEVEAVAQDILKLHKQGYRFREIGIIARDEDYGNLIKPLFEIHGIPFFIDNKRAAVHHPLAEFIRSALETLRGWRAEAIFRCLRTGFFEIAQTDIDLLENYVLEFGVRGEKNWTLEDNWQWYRHSLDNDKISETEAERRDTVDKIRRAVIAPLIKFSTAVKKKNTVRHLTTALFELIEDLNIYEKLFAWSELEESRGNLALAKEHLKIWDDVIILFEQVVEALNEDLITAREFELIINEGLDALEMSLIPPGLDEVTISAFNQNALQNSLAIYILGFNDSHFPEPAREKDLLSDADRLHLNDAGIEIAKGTSDLMLAEKFLVYRGLTEAKNYLHISYSLANAEGSAMHAAAILERFKIMFPALEIETVPLDILNNLGDDINFVFGEKTLSKKSAEKLYAPNKTLRGSVTNVESFNKCPFQYFAQYGLKLAERREYKILPPDVGNILHSVMSQFGERLKAENRRWSEIDSSELDKIVTEILDNTAPNLNNKILLSTNAYQHQRERIKKVAVTALEHLIELDKVSQFHPSFFEETFDTVNTRALIYDIDGVKMELTGKIDRVDLSESGKYFLIIDYKTGNAYLNLTEIFFGVNIQLLTYLMAVNGLEITGAREPAGMMYYFLKCPIKSADNADAAIKAADNALKMSGWTLDDTRIIKAIGTDFLKVKLNADGSIHSNTKAYVKSKEQFNMMMKFVEEVLKMSGKHILQGNISAKPFKSGKTDACKYCAFSEMCGFTAKSDGSDEISELDDNKILAKMAKLETGLD